MVVDFILSFSAGLLSFLSPCVLPLIPLYLSHLVGTSLSEVNSRQAKAHLLLRAAFFAVGFSLIFILLGLSVSAVSKLFSNHMDLIRQCGGVLIIIFGLHMAGVFKLGFLNKEKRLITKQSRPARPGQSSSFLLGVAFAVGWTPCIGPILSSILIYAGSNETVGKGAAMLVMYSLGFSLPILLAAVLVGNLTPILQKTKKYMPVVSVVSGIVMIVIGVLVFTNQLEALSKYGGLFNL